MEQSQLGGLCGASLPIKRLSGGLCQAVFAMTKLQKGGTTMTIHVLVELQPLEQAFDAVKDLLAEVVPAVIAEPGCLQYLLLEGGGTLVLQEEWEDSDSLTAHANGEAFKALTAGLDGKLDRPMTVRQLRRVAG